MSANTGDVLKKYKIPFKTKTDSLIEIDVGKICGSSFVQDYQELYLWNPSVGKYRALFSSCLKKRGECSYALGLGVYEPTYDFRVVYCKDDCGNLLGKVPPKVEVYSLRSNKWRRIRDPVVPKVGFLCGISAGNNMTYWLDTKRSKTVREDGWILSFDFNTEVFGKIKLPDDVRYCFGVVPNFALMKFEGKLALCVTSEIKESNGMRCQPCCICLMSYEDGKVTWTLKFKLVLKERVRPMSILVV